MESNTDQYLLEECIFQNYLQFCFYQNNLNSVYGEHVQFLDEKRIILPLQVTIREVSTTSTKVVKESKVAIKEPKVASLSQIKPKQALEMRIPALNKHMKLTKEVEDNSNNNNDRLIIQ